MLSVKMVSTGSKIALGLMFLSSPVFAMAYNKINIIPALKKGHYWKANRLLEEGANPNRCNGPLQRYPLHYAAREGLIKAAKKLLLYGAPATCRDSLGQTPLHLACRYNRHAMVDFFCKKDRHIINLQDSHGLAPLHVAALYNRPAVIQQLCALGASVDVQDDDKQTPLHIAALYDHQKIINILATHNANLDLQDANGDTPLHCAARLGHLNCVEILLKHGANPCIKNEAKKYPLDQAVNRYTNVAKLLMHHMTTKNKPQPQESLPSEEPLCMVCLDPYEDQDAWSLGCAHTFHAACVLQWQEYGHGCPICRKKDPMPE